MMRTLRLSLFLLLPGAAACDFDFTEPLGPAEMELQVNVDAIHRADSVHVFGRLAPWRSGGGPMPEVLSDMAVFGRPMHAQRSPGDRDDVLYVSGARIDGMDSITIVPPALEGLGTVRSFSLPIPSHVGADTVYSRSGGPIVIIPSPFPGLSDRVRWRFFLTRPQASVSLALDGRGDLPSRVEIARDWLPPVLTTTVYRAELHLTREYTIPLVPGLYSAEATVSSVMNWAVVVEP